MSDILSHIQAEWDKEDQKYESGGNSKNDDQESHVDGMNKWLVDNTDDIFNDIMKDQKKAPGYVLNDIPVRRHVRLLISPSNACADMKKKSNLILNLKIVII